ncbi:MAG: CRISPR-associated helicase Cas3' [Methanobacteriota archaeon]|nr:MAG: CRISPR-associated helicase Cas3' [Euryarchaeota archaeon]
MFGGEIFKPEVTNSNCNFEEGTKEPLMAKSKDRGGTDLVQHSIEAAAAALTAATRILLDPNHKEDVYRCSFIGGLLHDLGKAAAGFQEMIKLEDHPSWEGRRHEILSAAIFVHNFHTLPPLRKNPKLFLAIYLSIVTHHKPYREKGTTWPKSIPENQWPTYGQFKIMWNELVCNKELLQSDWKRIVNILKEDEWANQLLEEKWLPECIDLPENVECFRKFVEGELTVIEKGTERRLPNHKYGRGVVEDNFPQGFDRFFVSLVRSLVTVGDHLSSGNNNFVPPTPDLSKYRIVPEQYSLRPFQEKVGQFGTVMLRAPTGSGKTEAAFNWLTCNQKNEVGLSRIFYVLPVQASINAMYKRWSKFLELDKGYRVVALHHSRAANVYFHLLEEDMTTIDPETTKKEKIRSLEKQVNEPPTTIENVDPETFSSFVLDSPNWKTLHGRKVDHIISYAARDMARLAQEIFYPIKVTTPHQLLKVLMQGQGWEPMVCDFTKCLVVFDEIHSYDSNLTGLILNLAKTLTEQFDAKVLFMSATFPDLLKNLIYKHFGEHIPYISPDENDQADKEFLERIRHKIKIHEETVQNLIKKLSAEIERAESTLIICNTVRDAQNAYRIVKELFPNKDALLLHSRFKYGDRQQKEKKIIDEPSNGKVLVATQVVEVSLDIDYELGIIALAPLDALVQRLGRINRAGKRPLQKTNVHIAHQGKFAHLVYDNELLSRSKELLKRLDERELTEGDLIDLINELYDEDFWKKTGETTFNNAINHNRIANFKDVILPGTYRPWIDQIIENRERTTVDVLLETDWEDYAKYTRQGSLKAADLLIPAYVKKDDIVSPPGQPRIRNPPLLLNCKKHDYSYEFGLILKTTEEEEVR